MPEDVFSIVQRVLAFEPGAWEILQVKVRPSLIAGIRTVLRSASPQELEELLQSSYLALWIFLPGFHWDSSLYTAVRSIARNQALAWLKSRGRRLTLIDPLDKTAPMHAFPDHRPGPEALVSSRLEIACLDQSLKTSLTQQEYDCYYLHFHEGLSPFDVAVRMDLSTGHVYQLIYRVRQKALQLKEI